MGTCRDKLLPCPFCGAAATGPDRENAKGRPVWAISCALFCITMRRGTKKEVIESWNQRPKTLTFEDGYICAVANIVRSHGECVIARDALRGVRKVDPEKIDPDDREVLRKANLLEQLRG